MLTNAHETLNLGLEGVVAAATRISRVDGEKGELIIGGFALEALAPFHSFEEILFLLWNDRLPTDTELADLKQALRAARTIPKASLNLLEAAAEQDADTMDALRMGAASLGLNLKDDAQTQSVTAVAAFPTIVAAYYRLKKGLQPIAPHSELDHAANFLYMLEGREPEPERSRALETYLNTVVDHGLNASTFTARVIVSTRSDFISAVVGALGALKGPLHGGAPGPALDMVFAVGTADQAEPYIRSLLDRGERLMGFGHRVYKVRDPRAEVLSQAAARFYQRAGDQKLFHLAQEVEKTAVALLAEYKPNRRLQTNVEFYTALLLHGLGLPTELFTPTFAIGRVGGWTAHCFEQKKTDRLIRPKAVYVGQVRTETVKT